MKAADYRPLIVSYKQGRPVRLSEIGRVIDSVQNDKIASWFNNTRGIVLAIQRQPGVNTVEVVNKIRQMLPRFGRKFRRQFRWTFSMIARNRFVNRFTMCSLRCCSRLALW